MEETGGASPISRVAIDLGGANQRLHKFDLSKVIASGDPDKTIELFRMETGKNDWAFIQLQEDGSYRVWMYVIAASHCWYSLNFGDVERFVGRYFAEPHLSLFRSWLHESSKSIPLCGGSLKGLLIHWYLGRGIDMQIAR